MTRSKIIITLLLCGSYALSQEAPQVAAKPAKIIQPSFAYKLKADTLNAGGMQFDLAADSFITSGNYDDNGNFSTLNSGAGYSTSQGEVSTRYGWTTNLELLAGMRYRHNVSVLSNETTIASGMESAFAGFRYAMPEVAGYHYSFEVKYRQETFNNGGLYNSTNTSKIALGDEGSEFSLGMYLSKNFSSYHAISASAHYVLPPNELSHEVRMMFENSFHSSFLAAVVGFEGVYAVGNDPYTNDPNNRPTLAAGSTALFNSFNRQFVMPYGQVVLKVTKNTSLQAGVGKTFLGKSTDDGIKVFGGLTMTLNSGQTQEIVKINKFKEYNSEASIVSLSTQKQFVKIDQGLTGDFYKGMMVDIFESDFFGGNLLVASGHIYDVGASWAIVRVTKRYSDKDLVIGMTVRGY